MRLATRTVNFIKQILIKPSAPLQVSAPANLAPPPPRIRKRKPKLHREFYLLTTAFQTKKIARLAVCPRSLDPLHLVTCYIQWVKTSWAYSIKE